LNFKYYGWRTSKTSFEISSGPYEVSFGIEENQVGGVRELQGAGVAASRMRKLRTVQERKSGVVSSS